MIRSPTATVPTFKLYGETRHWPTPDLLHCESIQERSRLHDWHIHPHRHADLVHVLHICQGSVELDLEGSRNALIGPLVIVIPPMAIHGFHFSQGIQGHIITLAQPMVEWLGQTLADQATSLRRSDYHAMEAEDTQARRIATLVTQIDAEYRQPAPGRDHLLDALASALVVELSRLSNHDWRAANRPTPRSRDRASDHLKHYQALIEAQFRQQPSIEQLAGQLGMTSAHLNVLCRRLADRSALQLLHERVLLEAKRQLTYTNMTISQVADSLGFSEPAYFTRFFKRLTGCSPKAFRLRQGEAPPS